MEYITAALALILGGGIGFTFARLRGKGERISQRLQEKIDIQEKSLQSLQSKASSAKSDLKAAKGKRNSF